MLSLEELRVSVAAGEIDTVIVAMTDMQGRLQGKRFHARLLPRRGGGARHRGVRLPARRRHGDEHRGRLRAHLVGDRVRRLHARPRLGHAAGDPLAAGHRAGARRRGRGGPRPGRRRPRPGVAPPGAAGAARPGRGARLDRAGRHGARVRRLRGQLRAGLGLRLPLARPGEPLQRGLLRARHRADRAAAAGHQELDGRRGPVRRVRERRVQPTASTRSRSATTTR